ncbi:hypothetical protein BDV93DRAFT_190040 [Ceratobasidium sp. AG-I]|nr:hypothetical protein BDV93DRAFT_190040 [Ceratobasidium sp. AG-I]
MHTALVIASLSPATTHISPIALAHSLMQVRFIFRPRHTLQAALKINGQHAPFRPPLLVSPLNTKIVCFSQFVYASNGHHVFTQPFTRSATLRRVTSAEVCKLVSCCATANQPLYLLNNVTAHI